MPPAARQGDAVLGQDTHILLVPSGPSVTPTPTPMPFSGKITGGTSSDVLINGKPAAVQGSEAQNSPPHVAPPPATFQKPPDNKGTVQKGSATVLINGKPAARSGDPVMTCNDPAPAPNGKIMAVGNVEIGG